MVYVGGWIRMITLAGIFILKLIGGDDMDA